MAHKGWHKSDIKAALEKRGLTLVDLDRANSFPLQTCSAALHRPHLRAELAIAEVLGRSPRELWPQRYWPDGTRITPQPAENYKPRTAASPGQKREAA